MNHSYYSIYKVTRVVPNKSLTLYDMLLDTEHVVKERKGTEVLENGDIICSRIITVADQLGNDQSISVGMVPFTLHDVHIDVLEFKEILEKQCGLPLTKEAMIEHIQDDSLFFYLTLVSDANTKYNNMIRSLSNTDGELIKLHTLHYKLFITPEDAVQKLLPLNFQYGYDDIVGDAEFDENNKITKVAFPWLKKGNKIHDSWENTLLGDIVIKPGKLTVSVNSENRAKRIQKLLKKYLLDDISNPMIEIESVENHINNTKNTRDGLTEENTSILNHTPEAQELFQHITNEHYAQWPDTKIPLLDNKTPRQTVQTAAGKAKVEALLHDIESNQSMKAAHMQNIIIDFDAIRKELGLKV